MIQIPKFFHEILGEKQSKGELLSIVAFVLISGVTLAVTTYREWVVLPWIRQLVCWLLFLDISGGVVANLTQGTDAYYSERPKARWIFIAIHIHPLILAWAMYLPMNGILVLWVYTIAVAALLNRLRQQLNIHRELAGGLLGFGWLLLMLFSQKIPLFAGVLLGFYLFKVIYSFSVIHHKRMI